MPRFVHKDGRSIEVELRGRVIDVAGEGPIPAGAHTHTNPGEARDALGAMVGELRAADFRLEARKEADEDEEDDEEEDEDDGEDGERKRKPRIPSHAELEAALDEAGDDPAPYLVYADYLQSQNDPWGTLIALQAGGAKVREKADAYFEKWRETLFGDLAEAVEFRDVVPTWRFGFVIGAVLKQNVDASLAYPEMCNAFFAHRMSRLLESVEIVSGAGGSDALRTAPQSKRLRSVRVASVNELDLTFLPEACPNLETLIVTGEHARIALRFSRLRRLGLHQLELDRIADTLKVAACPELRTLEVDVMSLRWIDAPELAALTRLFQVTRVGAPALDHVVLSVSGDENAAGALRVLAQSPLSKYLRHVSLRFGYSPTIAALNGELEFLRGLESVHLAGRQPLRRSLAALTDALPNLRLRGTG